MVSIIIPARNEKFLQTTLNNIYENATGNYEILVGLDGYWPSPVLKDHPRVSIFHVSESINMRPMINNLVTMARGEYILKCDAHCAFSKGFDEEMANSCEDNWIMVPRQYSLNEEAWDRNTKKPYVDYWYVTHPQGFRESDGRPLGLHAVRWFDYKNDEKQIDDLMSFQGSCYFMKKDYFHQLNLLDTSLFGLFAYEASEIGMKAWLTGGRVAVNKKVWYAHLSKGKKHGRGYFLSKKAVTKGAKSHLNIIMNNELPGIVHDMKWFIDKFSPVPGWENFDWSKKWSAS